MPQFKIGDIVTGLEGNPGHYGFTRFPHRMKVIDVTSKTNISVIMLDGPEEGARAAVLAKFFQLLVGTGGKLKKVSTIVQPNSFRIRDGWKKSIKLLAKNATADDIHNHANASYVVLKADGTALEYFGYACHSALGRIENKGSLFVVSWVWDDNPHTKRYITWLLESKTYSPYIMNSSVKDIFKRGIIVRSDIPANMMSQIMVITRSLWEYRDLVDVWALLVDGGIDPTIAFGLSHCVTGTDGRYQRKIRDSLHNAMSGNYMNKEFFDNLQAGEMVNKNDNYTDNVNYRGLFSMWTETVLHDIVLVVNDKTLKPDTEEEINQWEATKKVKYISKKGLVSQMLKIAEGL